MTYRKRVDDTGTGVWHFSPKCPMWPQADYREATEPPSLIYEQLCGECMKLVPDAHPNKPGE
jgi:hypothetical protein